MREPISGNPPRVGPSIQERPPLERAPAIFNGRKVELVPASPPRVQHSGGLLHTIRNLASRAAIWIESQIARLRETPESRSFAQLLATAEEGVRAGSTEDLCPCPQHPEVTTGHYRDSRRCEIHWQATGETQSNVLVSRVIDASAEDKATGIGVLGEKMAGRPRVQLMALSSVLAQAPMIDLLKMFEESSHSRLADGGKVVFSGRQKPTDQKLTVIEQPGGILHVRVATVAQGDQISWEGADKKTHVGLLPESAQVSLGATVAVHPDGSMKLVGNVQVSSTLNKFPFSSVDIQY